MPLPRFLAAILFAAALTLAPAAGANLILGEFLGLGDGDNDSVEQILADFGLEVTMLARIDGDMFEGNVGDSVMMDGLSAFNFVEDLGEIVGGEWSYDGPEVANLIALKAGPNWGLWLFTDALTGNMPNMGLFDTAQLDPSNRRQAGDLTAYHLASAVPEPTVLGLLGLGLLGLGRAGRRRA